MTTFKKNFRMSVLKNLFPLPSLYSNLTAQTFQTDTNIDCAFAVGIANSDFGTNSRGT
jgi:hypothetical protein